MFYREAGDFSTTYAQDQQTFPIKFDRYRYYLVLFIAIVVVPFTVNDYWVNSLLLPFLIYAIAAIGLNILVGYCGQVSLGTGGFMAVGAYACYKFMTGVDIWWGGELLFRLPEFNIFFQRDHGRRYDGHCGRALWPAEFADQGLLSGRGDAGGAVLPCLAV